MDNAQTIKRDLDSLVADTQADYRVAVRDLSDFSQKMIVKKIDVDAQTKSMWTDRFKAFMQTLGIETSVDRLSQLMGEETFRRLIEIGLLNDIDVRSPRGTSSPRPGANGSQVPRDPGASRPASWMMANRSTRRSRRAARAGVPGLDDLLNGDAPEPN